MSRLTILTDEEKLIKIIDKQINLFNREKLNALLNAEKERSNGRYAVFHSPPLPSSPGPAAF